MSGRDKHRIFLDKYQHFCGIGIPLQGLQHQLHGHNRHRFGSKSESLDQLQLSLENEEIAVAAEEVDTPEPEASEPKKKPKRKPLPEHLERNEQVLTPGDNCSKCGGDLKALGEDITEELEYVPGRFCEQDHPPAHGLFVL